MFRAYFHIFLLSLLLLVIASIFVFIRRFLLQNSHCFFHFIIFSLLILLARRRLFVCSCEKCQFIKSCTKMELKFMDRWVYIKALEKEKLTMEIAVMTRLSSAEKKFQKKICAISAAKGERKKHSTISHQKFRSKYFWSLKVIKQVVLKTQHEKKANTHRSREDQTSHYKFKKWIDEKVEASYCVCVWLQ